MELTFWGLISYRVSLCIETCYEDQADLNAGIYLPLLYRVLGSKAFMITPTLAILAPDQRRVDMESQQ